MCKREFKTRDEAQACEDAHLVPASVKAVKYTSRAYPYQVEVEFENTDTKYLYSADSLSPSGIWDDVRP
jgi:hypothetical protein